MIKNLPLLFLFLLLNLQVKANEPEEMRAVWLTTNYQLDWPSETGVSDRVIMRQKAELVKMLNQLQHVGLNTIFFQARLKGTVFYHSAIEGQSKYQTGKAGVRSSFDALAFVVEECHKRGMKCHAWMVCMPLGGKKYIQQNGLDAFVRKNSSFITLHQGEYYLEPSAVQTADYLASIAEEMVRNYNIDGVHLDYIRYPENAALYPDRKRYDKSGKKESFAQWRRNNITNIVYTIYDRIKAVRS
ncbi:MAG: family 10 glycosylhydrolase, partial [Bacteroidales bacterium]